MKQTVKLYILGILLIITFIAVSLGGPAFFITAIGLLCTIEPQASNWYTACYVSAAVFIFGLISLIVANILED